MKEQAVRNFIGVVGNVISFCLFLSPIPTFLRIINIKAVEEFKPDPYMATVLNCALWILYGMPFVHPNSFLIITINGVGICIEIAYLLIFIIFATHNGRKKVARVLIIEAILFIGVVLVTLLFLHGTTKRSMLVGAVAVVFNVLMYFSPLTVMFKVIKTRSVKYMPFGLSLANFANGCVWTTYALMNPLDLYVLISNSIGVASGAVQLGLYGYFYYFGVKEEPEAEEGTRKQDIELAATQA